MCSSVEGIAKVYVRYRGNDGSTCAGGWACWYAYKVIKARWPVGEDVIMANPYSAYQYARDVIKDRWPEAEAVIATDPRWAFYYARYVIKGRWPEAETVIMTDPEWAYWYTYGLVEN